MELTSSTPFFDPSFKENPSVNGHVMKIMYTKKTEKEKIELLSQLYTETLNESALLEDVTKELENEIQVLMTDNEKLTTKACQLLKINQELSINNDNLTNKASTLETKIDMLVKQKNLIIKNCQQFKKVQKQQENEILDIATRQNKIEHKNNQFKHEINTLIHEKKEQEEIFVKQLNELEKKALDLENEKNQLSEQNKKHLIKQELIDEDLVLLQEENKQHQLTLKKIEDNELNPFNVLKGVMRTISPSKNEIEEFVVNSANLLLVLSKMY